ncbi:MAG: non-ribosomal peptide synthetase [Defluviitaleaceae bacterium]|nr:non-ribosomal peptide synthetase [Defluviitaleaceae bacterium]
MQMNTKDKLELIKMGKGLKSELASHIPADLLKVALKKYENETAIWFRDKEISYKELEVQIQMMATTLSTKGFKKGDVVGILLPRTPQLIVALLAAQRLGICWLPIDYGLPQDRVDYMLKKSDASGLMTTTEKVEEKHDEVKMYIDVNEIKKSTMRQASSSQIEPSDLSHILFTSGSTGVPKGVEIENKSLANLIYIMHHSIEWEEGSKIACVTSCSFDIFLVETLCSLAIGGCIVLFEDQDAKDPKRFKEIVTKAGVNYLQMTPTRLQALCTDEFASDAVLNRISKIILGGEAFPIQLLNKLQSYKQLNIYNMYAPTETCVYSMFKDMTNEREVTIGKPVLNTDVYLLDDELNLVSEGEKGTLWIGGAGIARGYVDAPELTSERFVKNPFREGKIYNTGDIAFWKNEEVLLVGRSDSQVKIRGYRVELNEIENVVKEYLGVQDAAVIARTSASGEDHLVSYFVTHEDQVVKERDLRQWMTLKLPQYMIPTQFIELEKIPQTTNGKMDRVLLATEVFMKQHALNKVDQSLVARQNYSTIPLEKQLHQIWSEVLERSDFEINQSFFDVGGNSFNIVMLQAEINQSFPDIFDATDLFNYPTIEEQCQKIKENLKDKQNEENNSKINFFTSHCRVESAVAKSVKQFCDYFDLSAFHVMIGFYALYQKVHHHSDELNLVALSEKQCDGYQFDLNQLVNLGEVFDVIKSKSDTNKDDMSAFENFKDKEKLIGFSSCIDTEKKALNYMEMLFVIHELDHELIEITVMCSKPASYKKIKNELSQYLLFVETSLLNILKSA